MGIFFLSADTDNWRLWYCRRLSAKAGNLPIESAARLGSIEIQSRSSLDQGKFLTRYRSRRANFLVSFALQTLFAHTKDTLCVSKSLDTVSVSRSPTQISCIGNSLAYKVESRKIKALIRPFSVTLGWLLGKSAYKGDFLWDKWLLYKRFLLYSLNRIWKLRTGWSIWSGSTFCWHWNISFTYSWNLLIRRTPFPT